MSETVDQQREILLANLLDTMRTFSRVRAEGEVWEADGLLCIYSGMPGAVFNSVLLTRPVTSAAELRVKFDYVNALYERQRARWSVWLLDWLVPADLRAELTELLNRYGTKVMSRGAAMYATQLLPPQRRLPALEVRPVGVPASRFDFCHVMAVAFRTPLATFLDVYHNNDYWAGAMRGFVAYSGNRALATACVMPARGVLGVYGVSVLPEVQRKGIGEMVVRHAVQAAMEETGLKACVLESSEMAEGLYRRLGFERIAGVSVYNEAR